MQLYILPQLKIPFHHGPSVDTSVGLASFRERAADVISMDKRDADVRLCITVEHRYMYLSGVRRIWTVYGYLTVFWLM